VGFVVGRIASHATSSIPILEPAAAVTPVAPIDGGDDAKPIAGMGLRPIATLPRSTMIGDLKLTALKSRLAKLGIAAEFAGEGVLVCGGAASKAAGETTSDSVAVRKTGRGKVVMEGTVSDVYYIVRKEIYNLHALVAA
jgi:cleavage and polyadenylation specificity factor subunit 2